MKRFAMLFAASAIALMATACTQPADTRDADVQAIKDVEAQWNNDYVSKDIEKISAHFAEGASVMASGMPPDIGKDAIRATLKQMLADPALELQFLASKVDVAKSGDLGYSEGNYTLTVTDPATKQPVHDHGSYVTVYRKLGDGTWKAVSDIASSAVPPPAPPAKKR